MTNVSKKYNCASRIEQYHAIQKGGPALYILARHSSHKASTTLSPKDKALRAEHNVPVCVIGSNILAVLLNRGDSVLLLDKVLRNLLQRNG